MKLPIRRYAPVVLWSGVIFALSSLPSTPAPETWWNFVLKKGAHVTEYAILYWLTWRARSVKSSTSLSLKTLQSLNDLRVSGVRPENSAPRDPNGREAGSSYLGPLLFTTLYAITDEIHQSFVPGRHARWYDIGFDTLGALIALQLTSRAKHV